MKRTSTNNGKKADIKAEDNGLNNNELQSQKESANIQIIEPRKRFLILNNSIYENNNLTALEIAILIKGLTSAPTYKITREKLIKRFKVSAATLEKALKSLKKYGYLMIERNGKNGSKWTFSQYPILNIASENEEQNELFLKIYQNIELINIDTLKTLYNAEKLTSGQVNKLLIKLIEISNTQWLHASQENRPTTKAVDGEQLINQMFNKSNKKKLNKDLEEAIKIANYKWIKD